MNGAKITVGIGGLAALLAAGLWWRKNPSACPYGQRFWLQPPRPVITAARLRDVLEPVSGERVLEVGPGTGYYAIPMARWLGNGQLDVFDIQQVMLDHTMGRAEEEGLHNIVPAQGDAQRLPYEDATFDAAYLATVLGEIPNLEQALRELARVLKPGGRLVVGEMLPDPHWVSPGRLDRGAIAAGLRFARRAGTPLGYFARYDRL
jgi:ubiquinone/menaquinone biosynthesis C-methylase UbiE